jgi:hypothetical protein
VSARAELIRVLQAKGAEYSLLATSAGGWALVVPGLAARVLGAGLGGRNAFWVSPQLESCLEGRDWNAGGQRTWLAPELGPRGFFGAQEKDWGVPPALDPGAYRLLESSPNSALCRSDCRLRSADGTEHRLQIERGVQLLEAPGQDPGSAVLLRIRNSLRNTDRKAIAGSVGLWSLVQAPCEPEGSLFLPDLPYRQRFGEVPSGWVRREAGRLVLRTAPACRWKVGQPPQGPEAAISQHRPAPDGGVRITLRCPTPAAGAYLDGGDALQVYNSPLCGREAFCELECHAPAPVLEPGQAAGQELEIEVAYDA